MPSLENSERVGSAAFFGIPFFDLFVWLLDNYARLEFLVNLSSRLPQFLLSPGTIFICLCLGLFLLHLSHKEQLARVARSASTSRRLVDMSGTEIFTVASPGWVIPVCVVFVVALLAAPTFAIGYSLADKGAAPQMPKAPSPSFLAYLKTPEPAKPHAQASQTTQAPVAIAPNGIANAAPNFWVETVNNGPPEPNVTWGQEGSPSSDTAKARTTVTLKVDHSMEIPAFIAVCDRACKTLGVSVQGFSRWRDLVIPGSPEWAGFVFLAPRPLGSGLAVSWTIESKDDQIPKVVNVLKVDRDSLPTDFR